jgi:hypothetical protein
VLNPVALLSAVIQSHLVFFLHCTPALLDVPPPSIPFGQALMEDARTYAPPHEEEEAPACKAPVDDTPGLLGGGGFGSSGGPGPGASVGDAFGGAFGSPSEPAPTMCSLDVAAKEPASPGSMRWAPKAGPYTRSRQSST